jgi:uncharacterized protein YndB with AHSA1/START domain
MSPVPSTSDAEFLRIERTLPAPRALVYRAFTDPARMMNWFGPHGFSATAIQLEVRVGGAWRGGMRGPDGRELIASGVYREVVPNERLVFTYAWEEDGVRGHETVCQVELSDADQHTLMRFTQGPFPTAADAEGHQGGWTEAFEKLARAVAK